MSRGTSGAVRTVVMSREKRVGGEDGNKRNSAAHLGPEVEAVLSGSAPVQASSPQETGPMPGQALRVAPTKHRRSRSAGSMKVRRVARRVFPFFIPFRRKRR